jgi:hypothetical protein
MFIIYFLTAMLHLGMAGSGMSCTNMAGLGVHSTSMAGSIAHCTSMAGFGLPNSSHQIKNEPSPTPSIPFAATNETSGFAKSVSESGARSEAHDSTRQLTTRIAVISDLNGPYGSLDYDWHVDSTVARIIRMQPDIVIVSGDMIAGQDRRLPDDRFAQMWATFEQRVTGPLRQAGIPFGFSIGNHDGSPSNAFNRERVAARAYWDNPAHDTLLDIVDRGDFPFYFSYLVNDVFIISWDASSAEISGPTLDWVEQQLRSDVASKAAYRIMLGHLPLYAAAVGRNRYGEILRNPDDLHALMQRYQVDMYVSGHHHAYFPGHRGGVDLLQTGALGGGPRPLLHFGASPRKTWSLLEVVSGGNREAQTSSTADNTHVHASNVESTQVSPEGWNQLPKPHQPVASVTVTTWDADTGETVHYDELPRYLHGLTGFTVLRDLPEVTRFASDWITNYAGPSVTATGGLQGRVDADSLYFSARVPDFFAGQAVRWQLHTMVAESEVSDTLASGQGYARLVEPLIEPQLPTFRTSVALKDLDSDALRGGVYYVSVFSEEGWLARARMMPAPNQAPAGVDVRSVRIDNVETDEHGYSVRLSWDRVMDPDGDGVWYLVRLKAGPGAPTAEAVVELEPGTRQVVLHLPDASRSWFVEITTHDGALMGPGKGVWVRAQP